MFIENEYVKSLWLRHLALWRQVSQPYSYVRNYRAINIWFLRNQDLCNRAAIHDHNLAVHEAVAITDHEGCVLRKFFRPAHPSG
jgi:hypothetical protein